MTWPKGVSVTDPSGAAVEMRGSSRGEQVTVNLAGANANLRVDSSFKIVQAVTVVALTGAVVPTLKLGSTTAPALPLVLNQIRDGLAVTGGLYVSNGAGGGFITLEIHGH